MYRAQQETHEALDTCYKYYIFIFIFIIINYFHMQQETHEALAVAMNRLGGKSNTGHITYFIFIFITIK